MDWVDYREKLGIGFADEDKYRYFKQKIFNAFEIMNDSSSDAEYFAFCNLTGSHINAHLMDGSAGTYRLEHIREIIQQNSKNLSEFLLCYLAFVNTREVRDYPALSKEDLFNFLSNSLKAAHIPFELLKEKGNYFLFPKGVEEMDKALVSDTFAWLAEYPQAQKTYTIALRQYLEGIYIRDVADNFRKSLEEFLQEFFGNTKNLDNNISEVGRYLKEQGGETEIVGALVKLVDLYKKLNDKIAKHNDKVDAKFLEFIMYQTGIFIRMLIVVKCDEKLVEYC